MSSNFQNRLVGTLVVVALAVTFLPDLLDGKKEYTQETFPVIPKHPAFEVVDVSEDKFPPIQTEPKPKIPHADEVLPQNVVAVTAGKRQPKNIKTVKEKPVKNELKKSLEHRPAWTLQVGTFKSAKNAHKLLQSLRTQGMKAYSVPSRIQDGELTKIFVGPHVKREELESLQVKVNKITKSKSVLLKFDPLRSL